MKVSQQRIHVDQAVIRILYYRYKQYTWPVIFIVATVFLWIFLIMPQIQNFFQTADQANVNRQTIAILTQNSNILSQTSTAELNDLTNTANLALPKDKNFEAVLNAVSNAASTANVSLADYSFQVGDLQNVLRQQGPLAIALSLSITGDIHDAQRFTNALQQQLPLAEITQLGLRTSSVGVNANFYYAPFPSPLINPDTPLPGLTQQQKNLLVSLKANVREAIPNSASTSAK